MLVLMLATSAALAADGNVLTNGGFDTGSTQPWVVWGSRTELSLDDPRSSAWSLRIGPDLPADARAQAGAFQDYEASPATHATVRGWFRAVDPFEGDARAELKLEFLDADSGEPTRVAIAPATALTPTDGWVCRETDAPIPANTGVIRVAALFFSDTGQGAGLVAVDDLALHLDSTGAPCDPGARPGPGDATDTDADTALGDTSGDASTDPTIDDEGCGCASAGAGAAGWLLAPLLLTRRRRRAHR